jgi:hypothetical protein
LEKAHAYVDGAIAGNAVDPSLTPAARADLLKRKARMRTGAIGFDMMKLEVKRRDARIATLEAELKAIKDTQPGGGEPGGDTNGAPAGDHRSRMEQRFQQRMAG